MIGRLHIIPLLQLTLPVGCTAYCGSYFLLYRFLSLFGENMILILFINNIEYL